MVDWCSFTHWVAFLYMITIAVLLAMILSGCNFLEVQVITTQRAIQDKGDYTRDGYLNSAEAEKNDVTSTIIKTIPIP